MTIPVSKGSVLHLRISGGLFGAEKIITEIAKNSTEYGCESMVDPIKEGESNLKL